MKEWKMPQKPTKIEIFDRATGKVLETKEIVDMKSWEFYWARQCDGEVFGWRVAGDGK